MKWINLIAAALLLNLLLLPVSHWLIYGNELRDCQEYFRSEQLEPFTDWIFMEGYALGLQHNTSCNDSVLVSSKEREAAEKLEYIKKLLTGSINSPQKEK